MKVYVVLHMTDDAHIAGIFSTLPKAEGFIERTFAPTQQQGEFEISEVIIDKDNYNKEEK
jgi:hypothetical protein